MTLAIYPFTDLYGSPLWELLFLLLFYRFVCILIHTIVFFYSPVITQFPQKHYKQFLEIWVVYKNWLSLSTCLLAPSKNSSKPWYMSKKGSFRFPAILLSAHQTLVSCLILMCLKQDLLLFLMPFDNGSWGVELKYFVVTITWKLWLLHDLFLQAYLHDI